MGDVAPQDSLLVVAKRHWRTFLPIWLFPITVVASVFLPVYATHPGAYPWVAVTAFLTCFLIADTPARRGLVTRAQTRFWALLVPLLISWASVFAAGAVWRVLDPPNEVSMTENVARVRVSADGRIILNGNDASLEDVREAFAGLAKDGGVVWYYREAADAKPHPNAMLVVEAIVEARLPVSLSTKADFSDVVSADGSTRPR
jgi:hypothetical protein